MKGGRPPASMPALSNAPEGEASPRPSTFDLAEPSRYRLGGRIGQGGMGRVFAARDQRLGRDVALKELLSCDAATEARLFREAQLTAELEHPAVVPVYDAGRTPEGRLFYTMRLVRGRTLADLIQAAPGAAERLLLVRHLLEAARGVAFAHQRGIVHRDLKPANILVGPLGETQVADWGLARRLDEADGPTHAEAPQGGELTRAGAVLGTPRYLAPELARGEPADPRSDVWSLGAVLHEIVAGAPPWSELEADAAVAETGHAGAPPLGTRAPGAPPELVAIGERATALDPARRYPTARELAADLSAWLEGRRVDAHAYSPLELLGRLVKAFRVPLAVTAVVLAAAAVAVTAAWLDAARERDGALAAKRVAQAALLDADRRLASLLSAQAKAAELEDQRPEAELLAAHSHALAASPEALGVLAAFAAQPRPRLELATPLACTLAVPGLDGGRWLCLDAAETTLYGADGAAEARFSLAGRDAAVDPSGRWALLRGWDDALSLLDLDARATRRIGQARAYGSYLGLDVTAGLAFSGDRGRVALIELGGGDERVVAPCGDADLQGVALDPRLPALAVLCADGRWLTLGFDGRSRSTRRVASDGLFARVVVARLTPAGDLLLGTHQGELGRVRAGADAAELLAARPELGQVRSLALSPSGRRVVVTGERGGPALFDLVAGAWVTSLPAFDRGRAAFLDEATLHTLGRRSARWRLPGGLGPLRLAADGGLASVAAAPGGAQVVAVGSHGRAFSFALPGGEAQRLQLGLERTIKQVAFSPSGEVLALGGVDRPGVLLAGAAGAPQGWLEAPARIRNLGWLQSGEVWALGYGEGPFVWRDGAPLALERRDEAWLDGATRGDGRGVVALDHRGGLWALGPGGLAPLGVAPGATQVASHDGAAVFIALGSAVLRLDAAGGEVWRAAAGSEVTELAVSPDGRYVAAGTVRGAIAIFDAGTGALTALLEAHRRRVGGLAFAGTRLFSAGWDGWVRVLALEALSAPPAPERLAAAWGLELEQVLEDR